MRVVNTALRHRFDEALRGFLSAATAPLATTAPDLAPFGAAAEAFVLDGGKRLRPAFCYWAHVGVGGDDDDRIVRAAAALELLQAGALVHDDVIDRSDTRRGAASVHRRFADMHRDARWAGDPDAFGQAAAILLGDLALVWADSMLVGSGMPSDALTNALPLWDLMRTEVMCGQYLDVLEQVRGGGSVERALLVAQLKSAKYTVERPLHLGAALGGAPDDTLAAFSRFGLPLGEAFQLRDDVLGVFGDPGATGKPAGDDVREGKRTVLVALGLEGADGSGRRLLAQLLGALDLDASGLATVRDILASSGAVERVEQLIAARLDEAMSALAALPVSESAREALSGLATAATSRDG
jgi:geranylgeranyl diphosphate synthase type I